MNREACLKSCMDSVAGILDAIEALPQAELSELDKEDTALVIVDMVNGFVKQGALASPRADAIAAPLAECVGRFRHAKWIALNDTHEADSPEFASYPPHCLKNDAESALIPELSGYNINIIPKQSTNGFHAPGFQEWLKQNPQINRFVVVGVCTDICVYQFALTLKTYFTSKGLDREVIVPANLVETFDLGAHGAELMNLVSLFSMMGNGIRVVKEIVS